MSLGRAAIDWTKRHWVWLKWPVALTLLACLFYANRQELGVLADEMSTRTVSWVDLFAAFALSAGSIVLTFYRWYLLVWAQEFPFSLGDALRLGFIGYLFNFIFAHHLLGA